MVRHGSFAADEVMALSWPMSVKRINEAAQPTINPPTCPPFPTTPHLVITTPSLFITTPHLFITTPSS